VNIHRDALNSLAAISKSGTRIIIASNSPRKHVFRVLDKLGVSRAIVEDIYTPDSNEEIVKSDVSFWSPILSKYPIELFDLTLLDDSLRSIETAEQVGLRVLHINSSCTFPEGE